MIFNEIPKTDEQKLLEHSNQILKDSNLLYSLIESQIRYLFDMVWNSEFSPQEVIDTLGSSALPMFVVSAQLQSILKSVNPQYEKLLPPFRYEIINGRVTVGEKVE